MKAPKNFNSTTSTINHSILAINVRFTACLVSVAKSPTLSKLPKEILLIIKTHAIDLDYEPRVFQLGKEMLCKTGRCGVDGKP